MTAVLRIQKINFNDRVDNGGKKRGISSGGLVAIMRHNQREDVNVLLEMKSKQATHIDERRSHKNVYFKNLNHYDIYKLKSNPHRSNSVGAFELIFDFQDLSADEIENFDVIEHKSLIDNFIANNELLGQYEVLSYTCHNDEKNPHFHIICSAWNESSQAYNFNDVFNPKIKTEPMLDENNEQIYIKHNRGLLKGQDKLNEFGEKIKKYKEERFNGTQKLQDLWKGHLENNNSQYSNKKAFTSMLHFSKSIWNRFSENTKQTIYLIREMENERIRAIKAEDFDLVLEYETLLKSSILEVMTTAQDIQTDQAIHRKKKRNKSTSNAIKTIKDKIC